MAPSGFESSSARLASTSCASDSVGARAIAFSVRTRAPSDRSYLRATSARPRIGTGGILRVALERFPVPLRRFVVPEALVKRSSPADPMVTRSRSSGPPPPQLVVGVLVQLEAPITLGAKIRIARQRQRLITRLRFDAAAMTLESRAVRGRGCSRAPWARQEHEPEDQAPPPAVLHLSCLVPAILI